jgi:protein-S-isoprenylcysteine O-methyltransferase Ste14
MGASESHGNFIYKIATGNRRVRNLLTPVGAIFFFSVVTLIVLASLWIDRLLAISNLIPEYWRSILGWPVLAIGLFLMIWSVATFTLSKGTPVPFNPPPALVTRGPYAYVRNPMISGLVVALFGLGLSLGSISLAFVFTPLFALLNLYELKKIEEPELERRLGQPYIEYKKRVPRFWPRLRGGSR